MGLVSWCGKPGKLILLDCVKTGNLKEMYRAQLHYPANRTAEKSPQCIYLVCVCTGMIVYVTDPDKFEYYEADSIKVEIKAVLTR